MAAEGCHRIEDKTDEYLQILPHKRNTESRRFTLSGMLRDFRKGGKVKMEAKIEIDHEDFIPRVAELSENGHFYHKATGFGYDQLKELFYHYADNPKFDSVESIEQELASWVWYEDGQDWYESNKMTEVFDEVLDHESDECGFTGYSVNDPCPGETGDKIHPDEIDDDAVDWLSGSSEVIVSDYGGVFIGDSPKV